MAYRLCGILLSLCTLSACGSSNGDGSGGRNGDLDSRTAIAIGQKVDVKGKLSANDDAGFVFLQEYKISVPARKRLEVNEGFFSFSCDDAAVIPERTYLLQKTPDAEARAAAKDDGTLTFGNVDKGTYLVSLVVASEHSCTINSGDFTIVAKDPVDNDPDQDTSGIPNTTLSGKIAGTDWTFVSGIARNKTGDESLLEIFLFDRQTDASTCTTGSFSSLPHLRVVGRRQPGTYAPVDTGHAATFNGSLTTADTLLVLSSVTNGTVAGKVRASLAQDTAISGTFTVTDCNNVPTTKAQCEARTGMAWHDNRCMTTTERDRLVCIADPTKKWENGACVPKVVGLSAFEGTYSANEGTLRSSTGPWSATESHASVVKSIYGSYDFNTWFKYNGSFGSGVQTWGVYLKYIEVDEDFNLHQECWVGNKSFKQIIGSVGATEVNIDRYYSTQDCSSEENVSYQLRKNADGSFTVAVARGGYSGQAVVR